MTNELEEARAAGVDFVLCGLPHYQLELSPEEVRRLIEIGRDRFLIEYFRIDAATWNAFLAHTVSGPTAACSATTRSGRACRGYVEQYYGGPDGFRLGVHDRCPVHRDR